MYKIEIKNAQVSDNGYGLYVNGKSLSDIISTLLGTKVGTKTAFVDNGLDDFYSNSCDITVTIKPHHVSEYFEDEEVSYNDLQAMEDIKYEQFEQKCKTPDTEE